MYILCRNVRYDWMNVYEQRSFDEWERRCVHNIPASQMFQKFTLKLTCFAPEKSAQKKQRERKLFIFQSRPFSGNKTCFVSGMFSRLNGSGINRWSRFLNKLPRLSNLGRKTGGKNCTPFPFVGTHPHPIKGPWLRFWRRCSELQNATDKKTYLHIFLFDFFHHQTWFTRLVSLQFYMLPNHDLLVNILASDPCTIDTRLRKNWNI